MGNNMLYAAYGAGQGGRTRDDNTVNPTPPPATITTNVNTPDYKTMNLVGVHTFSKRTLAYLGYVYVDPDGTSDVTHYTLGVKHTF
jgi:predicted porin